MKYNPKIALEALLNGEFDNPHLISYGDLSAVKSDDIRIIEAQILAGKDKALNQDYMMPGSAFQTLLSIVNELGTVNFSSHKQMREAIESSLALAEQKVKDILIQQTKGS